MVCPVLIGLFDSILPDYEFFAYFRHKTFYQIMCFENIASKSVDDFFIFLAVSFEDHFLVRMHCLCAYGWI